MYINSCHCFKGIDYEVVCWVALQIKEARIRTPYQLFPKFSRDYSFDTPDNVIVAEMNQAIEEALKIPLSELSEALV